MHQPNIDIQVFAKSTEQHPRQSEGTLLERGDGSLLFLWEEFDCSEHEAEDNAPNHLAAMISRDHGLSWSDARRVVETDRGDLNTVGPNLLRLPDGEILLLFRRNHSFRPGVDWPSSGWVWSSRDDGNTFTPKSTIWTDSSHLIGFASSTVKRISTGRILLPVERENEHQPHHYVTGTFFSDDGGCTWTCSDSWIHLPLDGAMEPHVEECQNGTLLMVMRTELGSVFRSKSFDGGRTWTPAQPLGMSAPASCPELFRIPSTNDLLLIWNHAEYDPNFGSHYGRRSPLTSAISDDNGETWKHFKNIETDPDWAYFNPGCSFISGNRIALNYAACQYQQRDGKLYMNGKRVDLKMALIDVEWFYS